MAENGIRASMTVRGFTIRDGTKRVALTATLEGDLPVDCGEWDRTKGCPFASVEVLDLDDDVLWDFQRPVVSAGETVTIQLRWAWSKRLPPDPKDAAGLLAARITSMTTTTNTLLAMLCGGMNGEEIQVRLFMSPKPAQDELPFGTKAKEIVRECIEQMRPKPGSGIESVTLSIEDKSVTFHSDGSTT